MKSNTLTFAQPSKPTIEETVDGDALLELLNRKDLVDALEAHAKSDCWYDQNQTGTLFNRLQSYHRKSKKIKYAYGKRTTAGRLYAKGVSLQNFPRSVREIICPTNVQDYDMVNANPTLIKQLCDVLKIKCITLSVYVEAREKLLERLKLATREEAKDAVLKVIFGGQVPEGLKDTWLQRLALEMQRIRDEVCAKFPATYEAVKHKPNAKASTLCRVINEIENMCLGALRDFSKKNKLITRVLLFDGLFLEGNAPEAFCEKASQYILDKTGFAITIKQKPIVKKTVQQACEDLKVGISKAETADCDKDNSRVFLEEGIFLTINAKHISCCAGMCMGKTEQTLKLVKKFHEQFKSVLFITQRISMASNI
jgi:hypothetical protein